MIRVLAGGKIPALLDLSTIGSLKRFVMRKLIFVKQRNMLTGAYIVLRSVERELQMVNRLWAHALVDQSEELERCAVLTGYGTENRSAAVTKCELTQAMHTMVVHGIFRSVFEPSTISSVFDAIFCTMQPSHG